MEGSMMQTWTLLSESGEFYDPADDPQQRVRPILAGKGPTIGWRPDDGRVSCHPAFGIEIKINSNGFKTVANVAGSASLYVTDRRIVLVISDVDQEPGLARGVGDMLSLGTSETLRDLFRSASGRAGLRDKFHLAAQIDYLSMALVRYYKTSMWGARSLLDVAALTGEPAPRVLEIVNTSFARKQDIAAIAGDIFARTRAAQMLESLRPLTQLQRQRLSETKFEKSGDGFLASFGTTCMPLTQLEGLVS
jgi:hypothetical protein